MTKNNLPPHLPAPTCNVSNHHLWQRLKLLFFLTGFSLFVALAGSSIFYGWMAPMVNQTQDFSTSYNLFISRAQLEEKVRKEVSERIFRIYKSFPKASGDISYLDESAYLGDAVIIGSDGWLAFYTEEPSLNWKTMFVLSDNGHIYEITDSYMDTYTGIVYLKINESNLKVAGFNGSLKDGDEVFVWQGSYWRQTFVRTRIYISDVYPHADASPIEKYVLDDSFSSGSVAINGQGRVVGFIKEDNIMLPGYYVSNILPGLLLNKSIVYKSLEVDGWFSQERKIVNGSEVIDGFYVSHSNNPSGLLLPGDVITTVNGRVVNEENLWYVTNNNEEGKVNLSVLRKGLLKTFEVPVVEKKAVK